MNAPMTEKWQWTVALKPYFVTTDHHRTLARQLHTIQQDKCMPHIHLRGKDMILSLWECIDRWFGQQIVCWTSFGLNFQFPDISPFRKAKGCDNEFPFVFRLCSVEAMLAEEQNVGEFSDIPTGQAYTYTTIFLLHNVNHYWHTTESAVSQANGDPL